MIKRKIKQLFCKHRNNKKVFPFYSNNGAIVFTICKECHKILSSEFMSDKELKELQQQEDRS